MYKRFSEKSKIGNIYHATLKAHKIPNEYVENPEKYADEIAIILSTNINYLMILANDLLPTELKMVQSVITFGKAFHSTIKLPDEAC